MTAWKLRALALIRNIVYWVQARFIFFIMFCLRLLPAKEALQVAGWLLRKIGPFTKRNTVAVDNLKLALPDISNAERNSIVDEMWENLGRLVGEYIFLDDVFDYNPEKPDAGHIEINGVEIFEKLRNDNKPKIFFTAHMGNFELLPIAAATYGLNVTAMFRPPNNPYFAKRVLGIRTTRMGHLVPSKAGAAINLARVLEAGGNVGILVDQKFSNGLPTHFFDQPVLTSPLLAKLARQYDCDVYPAFCLRLPGGRFKLTLEDKLTIPRDANGTINQLALMQEVNDHVERWVRAYPGQWMWIHNRWKRVNLKPLKINL